MKRKVSTISLMVSIIVALVLGYAHANNSNKINNTSVASIVAAYVAPQIECDTIGVSIANNSPLCIGQAATLTATANANNYLWSNGSTLATIAPTVQGVYTVTVTNSSTACTGSASTIVSFNSVPIVNITQSSPICLGGSVTVSASGGVSYIWSGPAGMSLLGTWTISQMSPDKQGVYYVTVTASNGCTAVDSTTLSITAPPTVTATNTGPICAGNSVTLNATGGIAYAWATQAGGAVANGASVTISALNATTTYFVTVTGANSCTATASTTVIAKKPSLSIQGNSLICSGGSTTLTAVNPNSNMSYLWNTGATTNSITVTTVGSYIVTITSASGCTNAQGTTVSYYSNASASLQATDNSICVGDNVLLFVQNAIPNSAFVWSTGATTEAINVTPMQTTTYSVTITNSCQPTAVVKTTNIVVNACAAIEPSPDCATPVSLCTEQTTFFASPINEGIAEGGNNYGCLQTQPNPSWFYLRIATPGAIHIQETNSANTDADFALWGPFPSLINAIDQCGDLLAPIDCSYSPQANEQIDIPTAATTGDVYLLLITNYGNALTDITLSEISSSPGSVDCTDIEDCSSFVVQLNAQNALCNQAGKIITTGYGGLLPYSFAWSNGSTTASLDPIAPGTYTVTVTTSNDCSQVHSATVLDENLFVPPNATTVNITANSAKLQWAAVPNASSYTVKGRLLGTTTWLTIPGITNTYRDITTLPACTGYEWAVRANCVGESSAYSSVVSFTTLGCGADERTNTLPSNETASSFSIYPNPATDQITIELNRFMAHTALLTITDLTGRTVLQQTIRGDNPAETLLVDTHTLVKGYYLVTLNDGIESMQQHLAIVR
ncbi:MAG: T9SS type A sorting domain-containing protein [Chitinophagales bacterium]|nr:T9SS type A sorting domain-containing protein [Chitinophagales bacterium]